MDRIRHIKDALKSSGARPRNLTDTQISMIAFPSHRYDDNFRAISLEKERKPSATFPHITAIQNRSLPLTGDRLTSEMDKLLKCHGIFGAPWESPTT